MATKERKDKPVVVETRHVRARVYKRNKTWFYVVYVPNSPHKNTVLARDNTNDFTQILNSAIRNVETFRRVWEAGHSVQIGYDW